MRNKWDVSLIIPTKIDLPDRLWTLMEIGAGGYILGRTAGKIRRTE